MIVNYDVLLYYANLKHSLHFIDSFFKFLRFPLYEFLFPGYFCEVLLKGSILLDKLVKLHRSILINFQFSSIQVLKALNCEKKYLFQSHVYCWP